MYMSACFLPAMPPIFWGPSPVFGWECLTSFEYIIPAWWANPAYFLALILYWRRHMRMAACFAGAAAALAYSFVLMDFQLEFIHRQEIGCHVWIIGIQVLACNLFWQEWLAWCKRREQLEIGPVDDVMTDRIEV